MVRRVLTGSGLRFAMLPLLLVLATLSSAQFRAAIEGTVADATGAVIAGAAVTATNQETGVSSSTVTTGAGFYRIAALPPGKYAVTVEASGFKKHEAKDVEVSADVVRGLNITMQPGAVAETITVTEEAPAVQTENANITKNIGSQELRRLPQFGREPYELLRLAPGIFGDGARSGLGGAVSLPNATGPGGSNAAIYQTENVVQISANGQRVTANNFQVDGVSVNSLTWGGAAVVTPNQESVQEIKVSSSTYSAEDGRNSGAQVNVVSKSGTNDFHGSAFIKTNDPGLNAYNKFYGRVESPTTLTCEGGSPNEFTIFANRCPERVNQHSRQFGGSFGGPIVKEKVFFFFSYDGFRRSATNFPVKYVETDQYRNDVIAARPSSVTEQIFSAPGIEPRVAAELSPSCADILGFIPCAVTPGGLDVGSLTGATGSYVLFSMPGGGGLDGIPDIRRVQLAVPERFQGDQLNGKVDWNRGSNRFSVNLYYTRSDNLAADADGGARPMADISSLRHNWSTTVNWTRTLSSTLLNEFRFNFSRWAFDEVQSNPNINFGIPRLEVEGLLSSGDRIRFGAPRSEGTPGIFAENQYELRDALSKVIRSHALKFGFEHRWEQSNNNLLGGSRPLFSFVRQWNLANDTPIFEAINADPRTGSSAEATAQRHFRNRNIAWFVQDDWKLRPNLTLNLGLRWEYYGPLRETDGIMSRLVLGSVGLPDAQIEVTNNLYDPDRNNFAPRIGFAWSPTAYNNKVVLRGGFGVNYNRIQRALFDNTRGNPPFFGRFNICCGTDASEFGLPYANGYIVYTLGSSSAVNSYPDNPILSTCFDDAGLPIPGCASFPANNVPSEVEIYSAFDNTPNAYVYSYSLETEISFPADVQIILGYQGSSSHKLIRIVNQNFVRTPENPLFFATYFPTADVNANFNALNARVVRRFKDGFQVDFKYRWSKSIDALSNDGPGAPTNQTFPQDLRTEFGPSDFDATHHLVFYGTWDLPILRGRKDTLGRLLGGWQMSGIFSFHSGFPWTPVNNACIVIPGGNFLCPVRPIAYLGGAGNDAGTDTFLQPGGNFPGPLPQPGLPFFDISASEPPGVGRNSFRGPRFSTVDLTFAKQFALPNLPLFGERANIDFRANFYNAFNKLNLAPFGFNSPSTIVQNTDFGRAINGLAGRVIEFQARFSF